MRIQFFLMITLLCGQWAVAQSNCWPNCSGSNDVTLAYRSRFPTMTFQGSPDCVKAVQEMTERYKEEDRAMESFHRKACAAFHGWVEKDPGSCNRGGPLCCEVDHWMKDASAWSRFQAEQKQIGDRRRAEVERLLKNCAQKEAQAATPTPAPKQTNQNTGPTQAQRQADLAKQQEAQRKQAAIAAENQRRAYQAELERKEAERRYKQEMVDLKVKTNYAIQELGSNLQEIANKQLVENFGSNVQVDKDVSIYNPLSSGSRRQQESTATNLSRSSQSLDDQDFESEYLKAAMEPVKEKMVEVVQEQIAESLGLEEVYKVGKDLYERSEKSKAGDDDDFLPEKATDYLLEKRIPNDLIKEHVSLNLKVIQSVGKKSLSIMDNTFSKIDDFFKELPDDEEVPSNRGYQTIRTGRSYFRSGNDEPEEPRSTPANTSSSNSANRSRSNSNQSTFFNQSTSRNNNNSYSAPSTKSTTNNRRNNSSASGTAGSANGPRNSTNSPDNTISTASTDYNSSINNSYGSSNYYSNIANASGPVYNYRYTPNRRTQPPPPTTRQQVNWSRVQKRRVTPYDAVPPPELRKGYWELNFCAFYCNFR